MMRRSAASPVATPGQGSRAPPVAGSSAIGSSARAQASEGHHTSVPKPQQAVVARLQLASPAQEAEVAKWRASVMEKKTFSGPHAVASLEAAKRNEAALEKQAVMERESAAFAKLEHTFNELALSFGEIPTKTDSCDFFKEINSFFGEFDKEVEKQAAVVVLVLGLRGMALAPIFSARSPLLGPNRDVA